MSLIAQCGACGKRYKLGDDKAGKKIKCQCGQVVAVPNLADDGADPWDNPEQELPAPPRRRSPPSASTGRSAAKPRPSSKAKSGGFPLGIVLGIVGGVVALAGIGLGVWYFALREKPATGSGSPVAATDGKPANESTPSKSPPVAAETPAPAAGVPSEAPTKAPTKQSDSVASSGKANPPAAKVPAAREIVKLTVEDVKEGRFPPDKKADPNVVFEVRGRVQMHTHSDTYGPGFLFTRAEQRKDQSGPTVDILLLDKSKKSEDVVPQWSIVTLHGKAYGSTLKDCEIIKVEPSPGP